MTSGEQQGSGTEEDASARPILRYPVRIVSGGQTGVDRAALDVARELGIERGGWCPAGRLAEDGRIADEYPLREAASSEPDVRTGANVRDSDGTLVVARAELRGGTLLTVREAERLGKPLLIVEVDDDDLDRHVRAWLQRERIEKLNVAGPRESEEPGIYELASLLLRRVLGGECGY
jgi:hypothetical protein